MPTTSQSPLHALSWLGWAVGSVACIQLATNPWYVAIVVACAISIGRLHRRPGPMRSATAVLLAVGVVFAIVRVTLVALTTHGVGDVLFRLPSATLPMIFGGFTVGGTIEAPVVLQELNSAWVVIGILVVFGTFNAVVSHHELIGLLPRAFHELGVVLTIGLTFVPMIVKSVTAVREADVARTGGRVIRRGRTLRTLVPVVETALERSVLLAESMDSRGFGRGQPTRRESGAAWLGLSAAFGLGAGVVALIGGRDGLALVCMTISAALFTSAIVFAAPDRARYRARSIVGLDVAVLSAMLVTPVLLVAIARVRNITLIWDVQTGVPQLSLLVVASLTLLCTPLMFKSST